MFRRSADIRDILFEDGECIVLTERRCLRLSEASSAVLWSLEKPAESTQVREYVESVCGPPPEGGFERLVDELIAAELVECDDMVPLVDP